MTVRVVFDANVWVSALAYPASLPAKVIGQALTGTVISLLSDPIVEQTCRALPKFGFTPIHVLKAEDEMRQHSILIKPIVVLSVITAKESDNRILECAVEGHADVIVTGDRKHLLPIGTYAGIPIISPAAFLESRQSVRPTR